MVGLMIFKRVQKIAVIAFLAVAFMLATQVVPAYADSLSDTSSVTEKHTTQQVVASKDNQAEVKASEDEKDSKQEASAKDKSVEKSEAVETKNDSKKQEKTESANEEKANASKNDKVDESDKTLSQTKVTAKFSQSKTVESEVSGAASSKTKFKVGVVKNGWVSESGKTYYYEKNQAQTGWVVNDKLDNYGMQRYWLNNEGVLQKNKLLAKNVVGWDVYATSKGYVARGKFKETDGKIYLANNDGKLENAGWLVTDNYDGGAQRYYIDSKTRACKAGFFRESKKLYHGDTNNGYVIRWKMKWGSGILLADNDGVIYEKEGWLVTDKYDGRKEKYRVDKSCGDYYGAHLGMFTISGEKYFGTYGEGYVYRNDYDYIEGHWYVANNDGILTNNDARFAVIERYVSWMLGVAADDSHGYDQAYRWGERGDYDCSSLTISALRAAGIDTLWATYTGNMRSALTQTGFYCRGFDNLKRGDILLNDTYHVAVYIGNGMLVQASGNEWGGAVGGEPGDQTGYEIWSCSYYDYPWDTVLRFDC